jgi:hypothetical protein
MRRTGGDHDRGIAQTEGGSFLERRASGRASSVPRLASCFSGRTSQVDDRNLQSRRCRELFQEPDQTRQVPDQRGCQERRLWRRRSVALGPGRPLDLTMIAFKGAKGIKDCSARARAILPNLVRSMCAAPVYCENSAQTRWPRRAEQPSCAVRLSRILGPRDIMRRKGGVLIVTEVSDDLRAHDEFVDEHIVNVWPPFLHYTGRRFLVTRVVANRFT